jgi:hypothetical protein
VDEWKIRPEQADNHWLDCLVGCAVAAGTVGCLLFGTESSQDQPKAKFCLSRMQNKRR